MSKNSSTEHGISNHSLQKPRRWRWFLVVISILILTPIALFLLNGLVLAQGEMPETGQYTDIPLSTPSDNGVTIVSYNIAKGFAHIGGTKFKSKTEVETHLKAMANAIRDEEPDFVFLSEALWDCGPCEVDQVAFLAHELGLPYYALGENYNVGVPFYRIAGGNAILSKVPLTPYLNVPIPGRKPFYVTENNRRALCVQTTINKKLYKLIALHNDSFDHNNNARQLEMIHNNFDKDTVIAGDFNAKPDEPQMMLLRDSGLYSGQFDGPATYPADDPKQRIDYVFAPYSWTHIETRVIDSEASDHRPVVARFQVAP